jgi:predicted nucleic acid-binding protein
VILADTSAWVEYDRATGSPADQRLAQLIAAEGPVAVTEPVVMEVLAGARGEREDDLWRLLLRFELHPFDATADFDGAVRRGHSPGIDRLHDRVRGVASGIHSACP